jgi:hypothetical protein
MINSQIDSILIEEFEKGLDPQHPEKSIIPAKIIGYGEMSTIFVIDAKGHEELAFKRMPIFISSKEMDDYTKLFDIYNRLLVSVGLNIPEFSSISVIPESGNMVIYNSQKKLNSKSICNRLLHDLDNESTIKLVILILREIKKVFDFNAANPGNEIGIDGQISNWAIKELNGGVILKETEFFYLDTSTPLMKKNGVEQLDPELFLRSTPSFLRWVIRLFFLDDVMNRYYDFRKVAIDLIANFYKEQKSEIIPELVNKANEFFEDECSVYKLFPLTVKEIDSYYKQDALTWRVYLSFRKLDRFLHLKILKKQYPYILPGNIKR